jgi:tRNA (guanine37-N1)-methyltransferase
MKAQPIVDAIKAIKSEQSRIVLLSPRGKKYSQKTAKNLANFQELVFICGHYEALMNALIHMSMKKFRSVTSF